MVCAYDGDLMSEVEMGMNSLCDPHNAITCSSWYYPQNGPFLISYWYNSMIVQYCNSLCIARTNEEAEQVHDGRALPPGGDGLVAVQEGGQYEQHTEQPGQDDERNGSVDSVQVELKPLN